MKNIILVSLFALFLSACDNSDTPPSDNPNKLINESGLSWTLYHHKIEMSSQIVETVPVKDIVKWMTDHKNIIVDSLASVDMSGHGNTTGYIVIYRINSNSPVEKTAKEQALDKLTDADRAALGLK